jgi:hypothetical protein
MKNATSPSIKLGASKILILVIIAVLVIGGIFVWQRWGKEWFLKKEKPRLPEGIEVIEQGDKKIVRNKAEGYEVTVPKEWKVDATKTQFYTPELLEEGGCKIEQGVSRREQEENTIDKIRQRLSKSIAEAFNPEEIEIDENEIIKIAGYEALKSTVKTYMGYTISVYLPVKNQEYYFIMYFNVDGFKSCTKYMDEFLKTISFLQN